MTKKRIIRKLLRLAAWILVGSGMITLLAAANRGQGDHTCRQVVVSIVGSGEKYYVEKGDILQQLKAGNHGSLIGKATTAVSLSGLEKSLLANPWIREAQLYFDSHDVLHVTVTEREPIARVFTTGGGSFYLDSTGKRMPLLDKVSIRLPVVSNFTPVRRLAHEDSICLQELTHVLQFINSDAFWKAQITQVDVRPDHQFELIPLIGNHVIRIGHGTALEEKFSNLFLFYKQVLSKAGFDTYKIVDVQYKRQVVGIKENPTATIDSVQLQKNIEALIQKSKDDALADSLFTDKVTEILQQKDTSTVRLDAIVRDTTVESTPNKTLPSVPVKSPAVKSSHPKEKPTVPVKKPVQKTVGKPAPKKGQQPKAVMKRQ